MTSAYNNTLTVVDTLKKQSARMCTVCLGHWTSSRHNQLEIPNTRNWLLSWIHFLSLYPELRLLFSTGLRYLWTFSEQYHYYFCAPGLFRKFIQSFASNKKRYAKCIFFCDEYVVQSFVARETDKTTVTFFITYSTRGGSFKTVHYARRCSSVSVMM